ncbi:hypothetical protein AnigIFM50267_002253 [Aspergillus niger]|nr:hypothetical protein AnigIFM50267_002253 [Aspergillus niger]
MTGITPHQLAQNGFYHSLNFGVGHVACCFTCGTQSLLKDLHKHGNELLHKAHEDDCLWQIIWRDLNLFQRPTSNPPLVAINSLPPNSPISNTLPSPNPNPQITISESNRQPTPQSAPPAPPPMGCPTLSNDPYTEPQPATPSLETRPAGSVQPRPPIPPPTNPSATHSQQPTFASVLKQHATPLQSTSQTDQPPTSTQSISKPHQSTTPKPTLTVEDPYRRFHNKPSPFEPEKTRRKRPVNPSRNKPHPHYSHCQNFSLQHYQHSRNFWWKRSQMQKTVA